MDVFVLVGLAFGGWGVISTAISVLFKVLEPCLSESSICSGKRMTGGKVLNGTLAVRVNERLGLGDFKGLSRTDGYLDAGSVVVVGMLLRDVFNWVVVAISVSSVESGDCMFGIVSLIIAVES